MLVLYAYTLVLAMEFMHGPFLLWHGFVCPQTWDTYEVADVCVSENWIERNFLNVQT
jgi:hypothetical protein